MNSLAKKLLDAFRQYKFGIFSIYLNQFLPSGFSYQNYIIFRYDLQDEKLEPSEADDFVKVKKVKDPEDELFKQFHKKYPAQEFVARIKKEKETLFIATKKREIVAYAWVAEKELFLKTINYRYTLNDDEIFLYSCFVSRENRGEGIHSLMIHERLKEYMTYGRYKTAYVGVLSANRGSIKGVRKAGFKQFKKIKYIKLFDREKKWGLEQTAQQTS